jgi:hypothetical protein
VLNNPLRYTDPSGHKEEGECGVKVCKEDSLPAPGVDKKQHERLRALQEEAELLSALMKMGEITDVEALARLVEFAAPLYGDDKNNFLTDLGIVVGGLEITHDIPFFNVIRNDDPLNQYYVGYSAFDPEHDTNGFIRKYNPMDENQVRHFLAGASGGNAYGGLGRPYLWLQEDAVEDRLLYEMSFIYVDFVYVYPLNATGDWVRTNLAK